MTSPLKPVPSVRNPGTAAAMIAVAASQLGYHEGENNDTIFGKLYGLNHQPWCAMFVSWVRGPAGTTKIIPKHAYTPAGAAWFKSHDRWGARPKVGAIVYFDTAGLGRISHVGIVEKVNADGTFYSIEGNTNAAGSREGAVVRRQHRRTVGAHGGFGYPAYVRSPARAPRPAPDGWVTYTVRPGDSLGAIAARHGTSVEKLVAKNGLHNPDAIAVGQHPQVPAGR